MTYGRETIVTHDWKKIFDDDELDHVIARMLRIQSVQHPVGKPRAEPDAFGPGPPIDGREHGVVRRPAPARRGDRWTDNARPTRQRTHGSETSGCTRAWWVGLRGTSAGTGAGASREVGV
jgi:hypothetical protein